MKSRIAFLIAATLALAACGLSDQQKADYDSVQRSGVSPAIYDKMTHGDPLSVGDIISLSQAHVSDGVMIRYIRDRGTVYILSTSEIGRMQHAGVSQSVIDYMLHTGTSGGPGPIPVSIGVGVGVGGGGYWR